MERYPIYPKWWTYILFLFLLKISLPKPSNHKLERQLCGYEHMLLLQRTQALLPAPMFNFSSRGFSTIHTLPSKFSFKWCTETYQSTQVHSHRYANTCTCAHKPNWKKIRTSSSYLTLLHKLLTFTVLWCVHLLITSLPCHLASLERRLCKHSELKPTSFRLHLPSCCWNSVWIRWPFNQEVLNI